MKCENCSKRHNGLYGSGKFCSQFCARSFSTKKKRQEINQRVSESLKGKKSGGSFKVGFDKNRHTFTDSDRKNAVKIRVQRFLEGREGIPFELLSKKYRKLLLIEIHGHRCQTCNCTEWFEKPIPIEEHHIDGDKTNNARENLMLVCPNCHTFTDTYRGKNISRKNNGK